MDIKKIKEQSFGKLDEIKNLNELERFRIKYLGRKGIITAILRSLKDLSIKEKKYIGRAANLLKEKLEEAMKEKIKKISAQDEVRQERQNDRIDITAPGIKLPQGHLHPITQVLRQVEEIFQSMGFKIIEGPDIETEYYNFDALNIPDEHPARDAWDTFWLKTKPEKLLRTHTSPMQIRYMEENNPPLRIIVPGRVFRYEATDSSHSHTFYQIEGLMVDKNLPTGRQGVNVANFKAVIEEFFNRLFSKDIKARLRPGYFPFTEPSFEVDIKGGRFKKWLEIMGAGMVHPNVFKAAGYNPANWQGFAFGLGLDRIAMMKYGIDDIRLFYKGDLRFLNQF